MPFNISDAVVHAGGTQIDVYLDLHSASTLNLVSSAAIVVKINGTPASSFTVTADADLIGLGIQSIVPTIDAGDVVTLDYSGAPTDIIDGEPDYLANVTAFVVRNLSTQPDFTETGAIVAVDGESIVITTDVGVGGLTITSGTHLVIKVNGSTITRTLTASTGSIDVTSLSVVIQSTDLVTMTYTGNGTDDIVDTATTLRSLADFSNISITNHSLVGADMSTPVTALAMGQQVEMRYIEEDTIGTTPDTPQTKILRTTSRDINLKRKTLESAEIRASRQIKDLRLGMYQVDGTLGFEMGLKSYDDFLVAQFGGAWTAVVISGSPVLAASTTTTNHITRSTGSWVTDDFRPGDLIKITGASNSANNGTFRVTGVTSSNLTIANAAMIAEVAGTLALSWPGKRLQVGTTMTTFTIERAFKDITKYQVFRGCSVNQWNNKIIPEKIVEGSFSILGITGIIPASSPLTATPTAAPTNAPMSAFDGNIYEGGTLIAVVTGEEFTASNNRQLSGVVGSKLSPTIFEGRFRCSGTLSAFFPDVSLLTKFVNETITQLWTKLDDLNGSDWLNIVFPAIKYTGDDMNPPAEGGVVQNLPFTALEDSTYGQTMWLQRSNAS